MPRMLEDLEAQPGYQNEDDERIKAAMIRAFTARLQIEPTNELARRRLAAIQGGQDIPPGVGRLPMSTPANEAMIQSVPPFVPQQNTLQGATTGFGALKPALDALVSSVSQAHIPQTPAEQQYGMPQIPSAGEVGQALNTSVIPQPSPLQQQMMPPGAFAQAGQQTGIPGAGLTGQAVERAAAGAAQAATPMSALAAGTFATPIGPALGQTLAPAIAADAMNRTAEAYGEGGIPGAVGGLAEFGGSMAPYLAGAARGLEGPRTPQGGLSVKQVENRGPEEIPFELGPAKPQPPREAKPLVSPEVRDAFNRGASTSTQATPFDLSGWDAGLSVKDVGTTELAKQLKEKHGLRELDLRDLPNGDVRLELIAVPKGEQGRGRGTAAMQEIAKWADENGKRVVLGTAEKGWRKEWGTTSESRLRDFYKEFGFKENKGRHKDYSMSLYDTMYREPNVGTLPQVPTSRDLAIARRTEAKERLRPAKPPDAGLMVAYHGSPYDFTEFDPSKIGSGEGAQAFGYGIYVAQNPHVANEYAKKLANPQTTPGSYESKSKWSVNGVPVPNGRSGHAALDTAGDIEQLLSARKNGYNDLANVASQNIERRIAYWRESGTKTGSAGEHMHDLVHFYENYVRDAKPSQIAENTATPNVYHVDVPDSHLSDFLDLDKPLSEQPSIYDKITSMPYESAKVLGAEKPLNRLGRGDQTGSEYYKDMVDRIGAEKASALLESVGIKGNKYLDQNSRDTSTRAGKIILRDKTTGETQIVSPKQLTSSTSRSAGKMSAANTLLGFDGDMQKAIDAIKRDMADPETEPRDARDFQHALNTLEHWQSNYDVSVDRGGTRNLVLFPNYAKSVKIVAKGGPVSEFRPKPKVGLGIEHIGNPTAEDILSGKGELFAPRVNPIYRSTPENIRQDVEAQVAEHLRKRTSLKELREEALKLDLAPEDMKQVAKLSAENIIRIIRVRDASEAIAARYSDAKENWLRVSKDGTPAEIEAAAKEKYAASLATLEGLKYSADVGRAASLSLNSMRIKTEGGRILPEQARKAVAKLLDALEQKDPAKAERVRQQILAPDFDLNDPVMLGKILRTNHPDVATFADKLYEYRIANVLWGLRTQSRNIAGNTAYTGLRPLETLISGHPGEAAADMYGMVMGLDDAVRGFFQAMKNEGSGGDVKGEIDIRNLPAIGGTKGEILRGGLRGLGAFDSFFRIVNSRGGARQAAYRVARNEMGLKPGEAFRVAEDLALDPTETAKPRKVLGGISIDRFAENAADVATNQQELGKVGQNIMAMKGVRHVALFRKTPMNLLKGGLWRSPLAPIGVAVKGIQGEYKGNRRGFQDDMAKVAIGGLVTAWAANYVLSGNITGGGPIDPKERKNWLDTGGKPYTFRAFGRNWPYLWMEPLGSTIGTIADFFEIRKHATPDQQKQFWSMIVRSGARNITDKTWLQGVMDFTGLVSDPIGKGEQAIAGGASTLIPGVSMLAGIARIHDPYIREARTLIDRIKVRVPYLRKQVRPAIDLYGDPVLSAEGERMQDLKQDSVAPWPVAGTVEGLASPMSPSRADKGDEVQKNIAELQIHVPTPGARITLPERRKDPNAPVRNFHVELTDDQHYRLLVLRGKLIKPVFKAIGKNPEYLSMDDDKKRMVITTVIDKYTEQAKMELLGEMAQKGELEPAMRQAYERAKMSKDRKNPWLPYRNPPSPKE